ncbi:MAG: PfkB family carbohydrate kinase [Planctomycetota bacterium]
MSLLVIGTLALDTVETPTDRRAEALGGSATYFAHAARHFGPVGVVGVVGRDFPSAALEGFRAAGIDTAGIEIVAGKTFRWGGRYAADWDTRTTLFTALNVFADFVPKVPPAQRAAAYVFLANAEPAVQMRALEQCTSPRLVVADTMNLWIDTQREAVGELLRRVDGIVLNDEEARMLAGGRDLVRAAGAIREMGPRFVVVKKGAQGAFLAGADLHFSLPAFLVEAVVDPTGAGDSFAGGFLGYLAAVDNLEPATLRRAMVYGTVAASFCVEGFGIETLASLRRSAIESRYNALVSIVTP